MYLTSVLLLKILAVLRNRISLPFWIDKLVYSGCRLFMTPLKFLLKVNVKMNQL